MLAMILRIPTMLKCVMQSEMEDAFMYQKMKRNFPMNIIEENKKNI